jgi:Fic family protein
LFARDTSEWINRVNQKHKQLVDLGLSTDQKVSLERWLETEFVYLTLKLEGPGVTREQVARIASDKSGAMPATDNEQDAVALLTSLRIVGSLAREKGKASELSADLLLQLHAAPAAAGFRSGPGNPSHKPKPVPPEHLPALLEGAFRWYTAESFAELNPVEQASIVLLRLIDLQPFEQSNERTALVAASLFTLRSELPPIIIKPEMTVAYRNALDEGARMNTKPMVEAVAEAVEKSLEELIEQSR